MNKFGRYALPVFVVGLLVVVIACEIDHGLHPVNYEIRGKIIFFKGEPPESTDRIEVFALKEFPPQDPQNFLYLGRSGAVNYSKGPEASYSIQVSPTTYELIGLVWKEKDQDWNLTGIMGLYTGGLQSFYPASVTVSKENPVVNDVDIYASWESVSRDARISGQITYEGEWPRDTGLVLLAVYRQKPQDESSLLFFENVDYTQPSFVESSSYRLLVNKGRYGYVVLYWVGKEISELTDVIEIGIYEDPANPGVPGVVDVAANEEAQNIDIHVNFNNIEFP